METLIAEITRLTDEWYFLIGGEHHKDKDCHWYIETKWSYGYIPKYIIQHRGYILGNLQEEFCSYEKALLGLKKILIEKIKEEKQNQKQAEQIS